MLVIEATQQHSVSTLEYCSVLLDVYVPDIISMGWCGVF